MKGTVLVTGGTRRLGKVIADHLASVGWRVLTTSHRADAGADIVADLTTATGAANLFDAACTLNGGRPPEALVNNAALFAGTEQAIRNLNFESPRTLTALMADRPHGRGCVVNILDCRVLGLAANEKSDAYSAAKLDLLKATHRDAAHFAATLRVNGVAPGPVMRPETVHEKAGTTPLGRPTPLCVAEAVAYLLSAESTSGCVIPVDGGQSLLAATVSSDSALAQRRGIP